jgi:hypothetical protein
MNSYHEIPISPNNIQPSAPPQYYDSTQHSTMNYSYSTSYPNTILYYNQNQNQNQNQNWRQEIEENQTASFVERKCLFLIFFSGFIIYLIYYLCKDAF